MSLFKDKFLGDRKDWSTLVDTATEFRRSLHQHPELTWQEHETAATIRRELDGLGVSWRACADTGTVATLAPKASGSCVALRGDMDALPLSERSGRDWSSKCDGVMHACGHDGHTATLMSLTAFLVAHEDKLPGPVRLLFQPAEEGGHGAKRMIEDGALETVDRVYGWHNWPAIPLGQAVCPDGAVMAGNGTFRIHLKGKGGHASQPEACKDPVLAAAAVTMALQQIVSRRLSPQRSVVVSLTSINAPSMDTIIPDEAHLGGSIRLADAADREPVTKLITEITEQTAAANGVKATVEHITRYEATVNDPTAAQMMRNELAQELGEDWHSTKTAVPIMASEDFSYYLQKCPGAFALIGANDGEHQHTVSCHNPEYDFNDRLIPIVTRVFARLAGLPADLLEDLPRDQ